MVAIKGYFDGKVFIPDGPVGPDLPRDRPLILHIEVPAESAQGPAGGLWETLERHAGSVEAPADWSSEHDHYLYGTPKRPDQAGR